MSAKFIVRTSRVFQTGSFTYWDRPEVKIFEVVFHGVKRFSSKIRVKRFVPVEGHNQFDDAQAYVGWLYIHGYINEEEYNEVYSLIGLHWMQDDQEGEADKQNSASSNSFSSYFPLG